MRKTTRKYYFWTIFIIFIIFAPLLILYTAGYRYDFDENKVVETGSFYFKTQPKQAQIYLDGELLEEDTPALLNNILPDEYEVVLSKDGYATWSKKLKVESGKTNFAQLVILFKDSLPEEIDKYPTDLPEVKVSELEIDFDIEVKGYSWDEDQENLLYYNEYEIWTFDRQAESKDLITRQSSVISEATWHPLGGYVVYSDDEGIKAVELDQRDTTQIYTLTDLKGSNLRLGDKGEFLYFEVEDKKYKLELY